jgi:hypothetical protein
MHAGGGADTHVVDSIHQSRQRQASDDDVRRRPCRARYLWLDRQPAGSMWAACPAMDGAPSAMAPAGKLKL